MELEPVIGLEIHVQLTTRSKMFCSCANIFGDVTPNSAICPICMGYPGTLPVPNATAIAWTQKAGAALNCELATQSKFDRKSYFYPDLPKGYQISQYDQPLCGKGSLTIEVEGTPRTIGITRIHLEEDAAKNTHDDATNSTLIDFNRAGTPLMEIVTEPDIRTPQEAKLFLQTLQSMMRALGVSDADMEKGQMRCDANISLREKGSNKLHPKTEIKNLNSFRFVEKALQYEIERQAGEWEKGEAPQVLSTRGFNSETGKTVLQRTKEEAADYRYFPEPDIPPLRFTAAEIEQITKSLPELPLARQERFSQEYGLSAAHAELLVLTPGLADYFEAVDSELQELQTETLAKEPAKQLRQLAVNVILRQLRELLIHETENKISPENFAELILLLENGKINKGAVAQVLAEMQKTGGDPDPIIQKLGLEQVSDTGELSTLIGEVIAENPDVVEKIKTGKASAAQFLVGKVMAKSKGKAKPDAVLQGIAKALNITI